MKYFSMLELVTNLCVVVCKPIQCSAWTKPGFWPWTQTGTKLNNNLLVYQFCYLSYSYIANLFSCYCKSILYFDKTQNNMNIIKDSFNFSLQMHEFQFLRNKLKPFFIFDLILKTQICEKILSSKSTVRKARNDEDEDDEEPKCRSVM